MAGCDSFKHMCVEITTVPELKLFLIQNANMIDSFPFVHFKGSTLTLVLRRRMDTASGHSRLCFEHEDTYWLAYTKYYSSVLYWKNLHSGKETGLHKPL